jgi:hypothetical protein
MPVIARHFGAQENAVHHMVATIEKLGAVHQEFAAWSAELAGTAEAAVLRAQRAHLC